MSGILTFLLIAASLSLGYYLYLNFSAGANAAYDAMAFVSSTLWVLAGIFAIMGGFVLLGGILIVVFSFIGLTKGVATKERLHARIAG